MSENNSYEQRRQERIERYRRRAEAARQRSDAAYQRSREAVEHIPFGQPILVGHHSEARHRADIRRSHQAMDRSVEEQKKAEYWEERARGAQSSNAIATDDPEALDKLRAKLATLEKAQATMKAANACIRKNDIEGLRALGLSDEQIYTLMNPKYSYERKGFQNYALANNNSEIRRVRQRLEKLEVQRAAEYSEESVNGITIIDNVEANRVQMIFPEKPDDKTRTALKRNGFRWAPSAGAWQRFRGNEALRRARAIAEAGGAS